MSYEDEYREYAIYCLRRGQIDEAAYWIELVVCGRLDFNRKNCPIPLRGLPRPNREKHL